MIVDRKPFVFLWRPIYRIFVEGLAWPAVRKIGSIATAPLISEIARLRSRISELEQGNQKAAAAISMTLAELVTTSAAVSRENAAQWAALEQLLLCTLSEPLAGDVGSESAKADDLQAYKNDA